MYRKLFFLLIIFASCRTVLTASEIAAPIGKTVFRCNFDRAWDRNYDDWPDRWDRITGPDYPKYVEIAIVGEKFPDERFLQIHLDGGRVGLLSPSIPISDKSTYRFSGQVRLRATQFDEAFFTISFFDNDKKPLGSFFSRKIEKTGGWMTLSIAPIEPPSASARFLRIGLFVTPTTKADLSGTVDFRDLRLARLPRLRLSSSSKLGLIDLQDKNQIIGQLTGVEPSSNKSATVALAVFGPFDQLLDRREINVPLEIEPEGKAEGALASGRFVWAAPIAQAGYYRVDARLLNKSAEGAKKASLCRDTLSLNILAQFASSPKSPFGWSLGRLPSTSDSANSQTLVANSGIGWIKLPIADFSEMSKSQIDQLNLLCDQLKSNSQRIVGVLDQGETMTDTIETDREQVEKSLRQTLERFVSRIGWWQLGADTDMSLNHKEDWQEKVAEIKKLFDQLAPKPRLGIPWSRSATIPSFISHDRANRGRIIDFLSIYLPADATRGNLASQLDETYSQQLPLWVTIRPLEPDGNLFSDRLADLVTRMIKLKIAGVDAIYLADPLSPGSGLVDCEGRPNRFFLPWRTTALMLGSATPAGSVELRDNRLENRLFIGPGGPTLVVWSRDPHGEPIRFDLDSIDPKTTAIDPFGTKLSPLIVSNGVRFIPIGPVPIFLVDISQSALARLKKVD
jgi:hypothetical protein